MENYFTFTRLLGLRDSEGANLPLFKDARVKRYQSVERIMELLEVAGSTRPRIPSPIITLNPLDRIYFLIQPSGMIRCPSPSSSAKDTGHMPAAFLPCWYTDIDPVLLLIQLQHLLHQHPLPHFPQRLPLPRGLHFRWCLRFIPQTNPQNQPFRWVLLPALSGACQAKRVFAWSPWYASWDVDVKKSVWWEEDFKETLGKIYRQANDNAASDFKDSELLLQDFINRYVDPNAASPMKNAINLWSHTSTISVFNP